MKISKYFVAIIFLLISCTTKDPESIADKIQITYSPSSEISISSKFGIGINIINESRYCIALPLVSGVKIYTESTVGRVEFENSIKYLGYENLEISPKGGILSEGSIGIAPDLSSVEILEPTQFFVSLSGYLCDDKSVNFTKVIPFTVKP